MSFRSMEFSAYLIFAVWTASMTYLTIGEERDRTMLFPDYYFLAERRLENHTIGTKYVKNLDECELLCYLNDNCVSLNFKKDPDTNLENNNLGYSCELNNANHLEYAIDFKTDAAFYYRGSKNTCRGKSMCQHNATCQSGFTLKEYRCLCSPGFEGEQCEKDIDECKTDPLKCHENAACNNTHGSYACSCNPGYTGDGRNCIADPCYHYESLSDADRKSSFETPNSPVLCDNQLPEGWHRFMGAAGTKMPTTRVPAYRCGTRWSGWLDGAHPTVDDGEVPRTVCFSKNGNGCKFTTKIRVKSCGSYFIYKFFRPPGCDSRYCATD